MTAIENVMAELYETLLHLRYPGIAHVTPKDMENTILRNENRLFLLSWLISQSPVVPSEEFANNLDEAKLVKWYTNMGVCISADSLLGKVSMHEQITTLRNLLIFMKNVLIVDGFNSWKESSGLDVLKKHIGGTINIIPPTCSLTLKLNYNEATQYLKTRRRSLSERRSSTKEAQVTLQRAQSTNEIFGTHGSNNSASSQEHDQEKVVEKFVESFESVSTWPRLKNEQSASTLWKSMNTHVEKVDSNMNMLKETLRAEEEISNFVIAERLTKREMPLDGIIEDIVIRLEEVNNLHMEE